MIVAYRKKSHWWINLGLIVLSLIFVLGLGFFGRAVFNYVNDPFIAHIPKNTSLYLKLDYPIFSSLKSERSGEFVEQLTPFLTKDQFKELLPYVENQFGLVMIRNSSAQKDLFTPVFYVEAYDKQSLFSLLDIWELHYFEKEEGIIVFSDVKNLDSLLIFEENYKFEEFFERPFWFFQGVLAKGFINASVLNGKESFPSSYFLKSLFIERTLVPLRLDVFEEKIVLEAKTSALNLYRNQYEDYGFKEIWANFSKELLLFFQISNLKEHSNILAKNMDEDSKEFVQSLKDKFFNSDIEDQLESLELSFFQTQSTNSTFSSWLIESPEISNEVIDEIKKVAILDFAVKNPVVSKEFLRDRTVSRTLLADPDHYIFKEIEENKNYFQLHDKNGVSHSLFFAKLKNAVILSDSSFVVKKFLKEDSFNEANLQWNSVCDSQKIIFFNKFSDRLTDLNTVILESAETKLRLCFDKLSL